MSMRLPNCLSALLALPLGAAWCCGAAGVAAAAEKPNVIWIMADDLGYGDVGCFGQKLIRTPRIDRMAAEGMKFTQFYAGSTVCAPSRSVLMTGEHAGRTPIRGNREYQPLGQHPLPEDAITVPALLGRAGYATGMFGKWGLGPPGSSGDPLKQGFDEYYGYICQRNAHTFYPPFLFHSGRRVEMDGKTYSHDLIMEQALEFIRRNKDRPFFCYLPVTIPHAAMQAPEPYVAPFRKRFAEFEDVIGRYSHGTEVRNPVAGFAGMIAKLDEDVGRVLDLLETLGIERRTLVVFTSDNGPHREGGHRPDLFGSSGPLRGLKRDLYEGGIRVPTIAWWPGTVEPNTQSRHVGYFGDLMATAAELAGSDLPPERDSISFVPALRGRDDEQKRHEFLYWEFHERGFSQAALYQGRWKGVRLRSLDAPMELYDLQSDIGEQNDVAAEHPVIVARIAAYLNSARTESEVWPIRQPSPGR
jgi:arylsulfatase A